MALNWVCVCVRHATGLTAEQMTGVGPAVERSRPCFLPLLIWHTPSQFGRGQKVRVGSRWTSTISHKIWLKQHSANHNLSVFSTYLQIFMAGYSSSLYNHILPVAVVADINLTLGQSWKWVLVCYKLRQRLVIHSSNHDIVLKIKLWNTKNIVLDSAATIPAFKRTINFERFKVKIDDSIFESDIWWDKA